MSWPDVALGTLLASVLALLIGFLALLTGFCSSQCEQTERECVSAGRAYVAGSCP